MSSAIETSPNDESEDSAPLLLGHGANDAHANTNEEGGGGHATQGEEATTGASSSSMLVVSAVAHCALLLLSFLILEVWLAFGPEECPHAPFARD
jgi:hypothetical protein